MLVTLGHTQFIPTNVGGKTIAVLSTGSCADHVLAIFRRRTILIRSTFRFAFPASTNHPVATVRIGFAFGNAFIVAADEIVLAVGILLTLVVGIHAVIVFAEKPCLAV